VSNTSEHPGLIQSEAIAWELAHKAKTVMDTRPPKPSFLRTIFRPLESSDTRRIRNNTETNAYLAVDILQAQIQALDEIQENAKVRALYPKLIANLGEIDEDAMYELSRMANMFGHELYKYRPNSELAELAFRIAHAIHQGSAAVVRGDQSKYSPSTLENIHKLCGTTRSRGKVPEKLDIRERDALETWSNLGFWVVERQIPGGMDTKVLGQAVLNVPMELNSREPCFEVVIQAGEPQI
jgi:hypothetical protein